MKTNQHIIDYLDFYIGNAKPKNYAILIDGDWGAGKTYFIKKYIAEKSDKHQFVYVSLYGVTDQSEIEEQIFQQLHPVLSSKPVSVLTKVAKGALKMGLKIDLDSNESKETTAEISIPNVKLSDFFIKAQNAILVFDDLERCAISVEKMLGYINYFCEHQNHKVIIVANEKEVLNISNPLNKYQESDRIKEKNKKYFEIKEKLIGRTFSIKANSAEALDVFLESIDDSAAKTFLVLNKAIALRTLEASTYNNLRSLKQAIIEWPRFFELLPSNAREKDELLKDAFMTMLIISFEIRKGTLQIDEIKVLSKHGYKYALKAKKDDVNSIQLIEKKYTSFYFEKICPSDFCWYSFFKEGTMPETELEASIKNSRFFRDESMENWVKLWYYYNLSECEFESLLNIVRSEFEKLSYTKYGVIKHIIGLYLRFAKEKMIDETTNQILKLGKRVINELDNNNKLEYEKPDKFRFEDVYAGLQYCEHKSSEFKQIADYLDSLAIKNEQSKFHQQAEELISLVKTNSRAFWEILSYRFQSQKFTNVPIFSYSNPELFVQAYLDCPNNQKDNIEYGFKDRYELMGHYKELLGDLDWLKQVRILMRKEMKKAKPLSKHILDCFLRGTIDPVIKKMSE